MKKKTIKTFLLTLLLTFLFSTTALAEEGRTECNEPVYTNTTSNIRVQPTTSSDKAGTVVKGTELLRTAVLDNGWSEVQYNGNTYYISSKLVSTTPMNNAPAGNSAPDTPPVESPAPAVQANNGETKTFSNGETFVHRGQTPNGLNIWYMSDDKGTWSDWIVAAYDATGITNDMSDYDKAVAINNYICRVVDYDNSIGADLQTSVTAGCLKTGGAICTGYSHAFDCLCTMAGVWSNEVTCTTNGAGHSCNYVLIGDTKYWVDTCWNDTTNNAYLMSTTLWSDHVYLYEKE